MHITRNTLRADGLTVGESMDRDAADLRSLGIPAINGAPTYDEQRETIRERCRQACLDALDSVADEITASRENGPKDHELAALFKGIDAIADRIFAKTLGF